MPGLSAERFKVFMHDAHGKELHIGDLVSVGFVVADLFPGADFCGVVLQRQVDGEQGLGLTCQAKQVELVSSSFSAVPAPDASAPAPSAPGDAPPAGDGEAQVGSEAQAEALVAPTRCDCPALDVPHVHAQGGPEPITVDFKDAVRQGDHGD